MNFQHSNLSTTAPSNTTSENPTKIHDTDIQRQELEKGTYLSKILKVNLNKQKNANTSWLVTTIKELLKTPIQKLDKPILLFKRTNDASSMSSKVLEALNVNLGAAISAQNNSSLN